MQFYFLLPTFEFIFNFIFKPMSISPAIGGVFDTHTTLGAPLTACRLYTFHTLTWGANLGRMFYQVGHTKELQLFKFCVGCSS